MHAHITYVRVCYVHAHTHSYIAVACMRPWVTFGPRTPATKKIKLLISHISRYHRDILNKCFEGTMFQHRANVKQPFAPKYVFQIIVFRNLYPIFASQI